MHPFSSLYYLLTPLLGTFVTILLLVLVWYKGRRDFSRRILCCLLLSVGLWALFVFGMRSSLDTHQAVLWARLIVPTASAIFVLYYHFSLAYTGNRGQRVILLVSYLVLVIAAGLIPTRLLVDRMVLEDYGYAPIMGTVGLPMVIGAMLLVGGGAYNLLRRYKVSRSYEERNRILYLVIASLFPLLGGVLDGFSDLPPAAIWTNLIFCILCSIAVVKYHLLDIRVAVRKSLVYVLVSIGIAIPYVSLLYLLHYIFKPAIELWWIHALIILLLAIVLRPLYSSAQQFVDRLFYRDRYDYLRALQRFSRQAQSIINLEKLGSNLIQLVSGALRTSSVCLLLPSEEKRGLVMASSTGLESHPSGVVLRDSSPLVKWLELHGDILSSEQLDIIPQLQSLSLKEKNNLERMGAQLIVPIRINQGQLSGILVLGQKLSHQYYSDEDKQLLTAVSNQMAMALENARLYEQTRESERKLRESEEFNSSLLSNSSYPIIVINPDTSVRYINPAMEQLTGFSSSEVIGWKAPYPWWIEEMVQKTSMDLKEAMRQGAKRLEKLFQKKDGERFWVEITSAPVMRNGEFVYYLSSWIDTTERKLAEEREKKLQQELYLSSRLAAIGQLAAGVAHEINNPLTGILGFSQRLLRKSTDEESSRGLEIIQNEAQRAAKVVQNLLTFARRYKSTKEYSDVSDILQKALELRAYGLKTGNIEFVLNLAPSLPKAMVDFNQIQEVFLNIIINAEQSMIEANKGGKLSIKTQETKGYIRVMFTDDGPGIAPENLDKIFDPFLTTRGERDGTGLGLSICHGIMAEHGGRIYARSDPGEGATFIIELPVITEEAEKSKIRDE